MSDTILNITLKKGGQPAAQQPMGEPPVLPFLTFKGPESMPFLAPRGVFLKNGRLLVSDTGRNRVFLWNLFPEQEFGEPDVTLGQEDSQNVQRNAGGAVGACTLQYPSGVWTDGQKLIVADAWNHRVLIWHTMPEYDGQPADVVVGQPDFDHNQPNAVGVGAQPTARTLFWPYGVFSDGRSLWIADTGNRRVLYFENLPETHFAPADKVVGKPDFVTRDYESDDPIWPYSVKIGPQGAMAVADTQYYRVLLWHDWRTALDQKADVVLGQQDLESNGMNQYGLQPMPHTLSWCYDAVFAGEGLLIADTGNSRVLHHKTLPVVSNTPAAGLFGKPDFYTGSENAETVFGTEKTMYWPFSICADSGVLAVADTGNHRILFYRY